MHPNVHFERRGFSAGRFRTGVSLHSHTSHSCEPLSTVYSFARKIGPLRLILATLERTLRRATARCWKERSGSCNVATSPGAGNIQPAYPGVPVRSTHR